MAKKLIDEPEVQEPKVKAVKKESVMSDKDIYDAVNYLKEMITAEMNRRKKAGEKWRMLVALNGNLMVTAQNARKLATGGYSTRMAHPEV